MGATMSGMAPSGVRDMTMRTPFLLAFVVGLMCRPVAAQEQPAGGTAGTPEARTGAVFPAQTPGGYLVVLVAGGAGGRADAGAFAEVARRAAKLHRAEVLDFDGKDFGALEAELRKRMPEQVLIVVPPDVFDVHFHRRILLLSNRLDDDPFADFAFGCLTARDGTVLRALWERTETLLGKGLRNRTWVETGVISKGKSFRAEGRIPDEAKAAGFSGAEHYFAVVENEPDTRDRAREALKALEEASVICMSGNGDPQGIWLFDGNRNRDRSKHWPFDPAKVGRDPKGEMPRLLAADFRKLELGGAVVWSGTCHSGATRRVLVEGDIVSTFGRSETVAEYLLPADESLGLALLDAGAGALIVPVAANHGMSSAREIAFAFAHGAALGEAVKSTWDDVFLQCGGDLKLDFDAPGSKPGRGTEHVMQGGGANRVLIGDPAIRPFARTAHPGEKVEVRKRDGGFGVEVTLADGFHAWDWDMFGTDRERDWRIGARVALDELIPAGKSPSFTATVEAWDGKDQPAPHVLAHAVAESYHGRRFLHLQANAPRKDLAYKARRAVFRVTLTP